MAAYKRSNPVQNMKEQAQIMRDVEERQNLPQSERMFPNLLEQGRRLVSRASERRRTRKNPPPQIEGAKVIGSRKGSNTA